MILIRTFIVKKDLLFQTCKLKYFLNTQIQAYTREVNMWPKKVKIYIQKPYVTKI